MTERKSRSRAAYLDRKLNAAIPQDAFGHLDIRVHARFDPNGLRNLELCDILTTATAIWYEDPDDPDSYDGYVVCAVKVTDDMDERAVMAALIDAARRSADEDTGPDAGTTRGRVVPALEAMRERMSR